MLSISSRGNAASATTYYEHLSIDSGDKELEDYYSQGHQGCFLGTGAKTLGFSGGVTRDDFEQLASGCTPFGDCQGAGADHRAGWDLTFSTPKSVSILWANASTGDRVKIEAAHNKAVANSIKFVEAHAAYGRRGARGENHEKVGLVVAAYMHGTSREQDPELHSHCFIFNVAPRNDGSIGGIEGRYFYEWKMAGGAVYRSELASELKKLGYVMERDRTSFKVIGVPDELCSQFSKRRKQIEKALSEHSVTSARASEVAALSTRRAKVEMDRETLINAWQKTTREIYPDWMPEQCLNQPLREHIPLDIRSIQDQMTQQRSTVSEAQLYAHVAQDRQVYSNIIEIEKFVSELKADHETVPLAGHHYEARFTTKKMQQLEAAMVDRAERMSKANTHEVSADIIAAVIDARPTLSNEQRAAIKHITKDNALSVIQGDAGTGKSFMLGAANDAWQSTRFRVRGVSLSGKAAQELQQSSGIQSTTLKRFEMDSRGYIDDKGQQHAPTDKLSQNDILVMDEAGMSGSRATAALLEDAERVGCKVVLIGDSRQLQAISAGAAFRAIAEHTGSVSLVDIRRQNDLQDRQAVRDLRDGKADQALENFAQRHRVHESNTSREAKEETGKAVAQDLLEGKRSLAITGTRVEALDVNQAAREAAREKCLVAAQEVTVSTSNGERHFAEGDRMLFCRNNKTLDVKNGDLGTVKSIHELDGCVYMTVTLDRGGERNVDTLKYDHLAYGYCVTTHKAQGSTVDRCHILVTDNGMNSREWGYVAASRAKEETHIHADKYTLQELAPAWSKARQKDVSLDYQLAEEREYEKPRGKVREAHVQEPIFEFTRNN